MCIALATAAENAQPIFSRRSNPASLQREMWQFIIKIIVTALVVVGVSEIAKRSSL